MSEKSNRGQIVGILIRLVHPEIISMHSRPERIAKFQMKFVLMGLYIIQLPYKKMCSLSGKQ